MERTTGVSTSLCVRAKNRFAVNSMQTVCGQCISSSQSHPHIRTFGSRIVREPFGALVHTRLKNVTAILFFFSSVV